MKKNSETASGKKEKKPAAKNEAAQRDAAGA